MNKLNQSKSAHNFTLKFLHTILPSLKNKIDEINPTNLEYNFNIILEENLDRLKMLFEYNDLPKVSDQVLLKYTLKIASNLIKELKDLLRDHLNKQLLDIEVRTENIKVKEDVIWNKINKLFLQWESAQEKLIIKQN
ncbi:MAG: hypothetical protein ACXAC7_08515, partial [Candidatus Hodarchaeales archaeon]|jgi:hypothetical protein